jgi:hypothetical protein
MMFRRYPFRENLQGCSRLVTATRIELGRWQPDRYGMLDVRQRPGCLSVAVSEAQVHRTLLILDTLLREFEKREVTVIPVSEDKLSRLVVDAYPRRAWHDGKEQRLEELLGEIVGGTSSSESS